MVILMMIMMVVPLSGDGHASGDIDDDNLNDHPWCQCSDSDGGGDILY